MNTNQIAKSQTLIIGTRLKAIRKLLILSLKKVATGSNLTVATLKKLEDGKGNVHLINLFKLLAFYGIPLLEFLDFSKELNEAKVYKANMIKFHKKNNSDVHKVLAEKPDLIDLIELRLLDLNLFQDWVDVQAVDEYIKTAFDLSYTNTSGTLLTAVKNGWLTSRKKHAENDKARVNEYIINSTKEIK